MLTLPDIKAKQILFIQTELGVKNRLFFRNENIVFEKDNQIINQASCHKVLSVFIIGDFSFTSGLVRECRKRGVSLFFLWRNFRLYGSINARADGNFLLRSAQYTMKLKRELALARYCVENKIQNQIRLLQDAKFFFNQSFADKTLTDTLLARNDNQLLGLEGNFSKLFFKAYFAEIDWFRRMPRAKPDIPNLLLDMGYTFLFNFIDSLLLLFGFDTYKGVYHKLFFQRKSLSCDVIEPFRSIIEKQILKSYHLKQINEEDFFIEQGRYILTYDKSQKYAKIFMEAIMDHKECIYLYTQKFYRAVMNEENNFPQFNVITKQVK